MASRGRCRCKSFIFNALWKLLSGSHFVYLRVNYYMKTCCRCFQQKPLSEFYKSSRQTCGVRSECKKCSSKKPRVSDMNQEAYKRYRDYRNQDFKRRYHNDLDFRVQRNLRERMRKALKGMSKAETTSSLLGCSVEQFKQHIESLWLAGMSWGNYGYNGWHIDHIKPLDSFDLSDTRNQQKAFHFSNLQPLWSADNIKKGKSLAATTTARDRA